MLSTGPRCVQILSCRAQVFRRLGWAVTSTVSGLVDSEGCRVMRFARLPRGLVAVLVFCSTLGFTAYAATHTGHHVKV